MMYAKSISCRREKTIAAQSLIQSGAVVSRTSDLWSCTLALQDGTFLVYTMPDAAGTLGSRCGLLGFGPCLDR